MFCHICLRATFSKQSLATIGFARYIKNNTTKQTARPWHPMAIISMPAAHSHPPTP
jgi:hypothetical protein